MAKKITKPKEFKCKVSDHVIHRGKIVYVSEILLQGSEPFVNKKGKEIPGKRSEIAICRIMENGQVLRRSKKYIGQDWEHIK